MSRCNLPTFLFIPAIPGIPPVPGLPTDFLEILAQVEAMYAPFVPDFSLPCPLD